MNTTMKRTRTIKYAKVGFEDFNKKLYLECVTKAARMSNADLAAYIDAGIDQITNDGIESVSSELRERLAIMAFLLNRRPK